MSNKTEKMKLITWDENDYFNDEELRKNWGIVDLHNHSDKGGVQIPKGGLASSSVGTSELVDYSVTNVKVADSSIGQSKLQPDLYDALQTAKTSLSLTTQFTGDVSGLYNELKLQDGTVKDTHIAAKNTQIGYLGISPSKLDITTVSNNQLSATNKVVDLSGVAKALKDLVASSSDLSSNNKVIDQSYAIPRSNLKNTVGGSGNATPYLVTWEDSTTSGSLPTGAIDGDEVYYCADYNQSVIWHLRYNGTISTPNWVFIGGNPLKSTQTVSSYGSTTGSGTGSSLIKTNTNYSVWPNAGSRVTGAATYRKVSGGVALNNFKMPLKGTFSASYYVKMGLDDPSSGTGNSGNPTYGGAFSTSIGLAVSAPSYSTNDNTTFLTTPLANSNGVSYFHQTIHANISASRDNFYFDMSDASKKYVRQIVTIESFGATATTEDVRLDDGTTTNRLSDSAEQAYINLLERQLSIRPVTVTNW